MIGSPGFSSCTILDLAFPQRHGMSEEGVAGRRKRAMLDLGQWPDHERRFVLVPQHRLFETDEQTYTRSTTLDRHQLQHGRQFDLAEL